MRILAQKCSVLHCLGAFEPADTSRKGLRGREEVLEKSNTWPEQVLDTLNSCWRALLESLSNTQANVRRSSLDTQLSKPRCPSAPQGGIRARRPITGSPLAPGGSREPVSSRALLARSSLSHAQEYIFHMFLPPASGDPKGGQSKAGSSLPKPSAFYGRHGHNGR